MPEKEFIPEPEETKETKEKEPEMRLKFFFSPHLKKEDFAKLREEIEDSDVYIPESFMYSPEITERYRKLSQGKLSPEKLAQQFKAATKEVPETERKLWEAVYNSKKPIYFVDVPESQESFTKLWKVQGKFDNLAFVDFLTGEFSSALANRKTCIELFDQLQEERENYIKANIEQLKPKILKDHPEFKSKKGIRVLASLGWGHTSLYHRFKKEKKIPIQQIFASLPAVFHIFAELQRDRRFFSEKELDREKLAQSFMEEILGLALVEHKNIRSTDELCKVARHLASKFKEKDSEDFSRMLGEKYFTILPKLTSFSMFGLKPKWRELFEPPLKEWGVKLPKTREEVEEIIKKAERKK